MDFDYEKLASMMAKPNKWQISSIISVIIGAILCFISLFLPFPTYLYTLAIGAILIIYFLIIKFVVLKKPSVKETKVKVKKNKKVGVQKALKNPDDNTKVIAVCPYCQKKLRLPNKKGVHGVDCPICKKHFELKIK